MTPARNPETPHVPRLPGRYQIAGLLGEGGMGRVFKAWDSTAGSFVALKVLRAPSVEDRRRFELEIRILSRLQHEGIVRLFDAGEAGAEIYFTMELLQGFPLTRLLDGPLPHEGRIRWILGVAGKGLDALAHIHDRGILHRDLKPSNWMVLRSPEPGGDAREPPCASLEEVLLDPHPTVKLLDLGLARDREALFGRSGADADLAGTPLYMPPEVATGASPLDERGDIYSTGALLYHLLAGRAPFRTLTEVISRRQGPVPPHALNPACPEIVSRTILEWIDLEPHRRPSSAVEAREKLLSLLGGSARLSAAPARLLAPGFVGRTREIGILSARVARAASGEGGSIALEGERASGKTWLIERSGFLSEALVSHGLVSIRGRFRRGGLLHEGLRDVFREILTLGDEATERPGPVEATSGDGQWRDVLVESLRLGSMEPLAASGPAGTAKSEPLPTPLASVRRERFLHGCAQALRRAVRAHPLILVLEDIQNADDLEMDALLRLRRTVRGLPAAIIVTYRPEAVRESPQLARWVAETGEEMGPEPLRLSTFTDGDVAALAECMLRPSGKAPPEMVSFLAQRSGGEPLLAARWLQVLWERGAIEHAEGRWRFSSLEEPSASIPHDAWIEVIAALEPADLQVLAAAMVLGAPFEAGLLVRLLPPEWEEGLSGRLRSLARRGLLVEESEGFAPPHDLSEESLEGRVVASRLGEEDFSALHLAAAEALLDLYRGSEESHAFQAAAHLERAGRPGRARQLYLAAARHAGRIYANQRGIDAYQRALALTTEAGVRRVLHEELGELLARIGEYPAALDCFRLARAEGSLEPRAEASLLDKAGRVHQRRGEFQEALAMFSRCLELAGDDAEARARSLLLIGGIYLECGDPVSARACLEESLSLHVKLEDHERAAAAQASLGLVEKSLGRLERAVERFQEAHDNAERSGSLLEVAYTLNNLGNLHRAMGDDHGAVDCLRRSIEARERVGDRQGLAICLNNIARVHAYRGELAAAAASTERALGIFEEIGDQKGVLIARCNLGELVHQRGGLAAARGILAANVEAAGKLKVQRLLEASLSNLGALELDAGDAEKAMEHLRRALKTLSGDKPLELRAHALGLFARASLQLRDFEGAEDSLREAMEIARELKLREKLGLLASLEVEISLERGDLERALAAGRSFLPDLEKGVERLGRASFRHQLGRVYRELGPDWADQTEKNLGTALREFEAMGSPHNAAAVRADLGVYWQLLGEDADAKIHFERAEEEFRKAGALRRIDALRRLSAFPGEGPVVTEESRR
ncbi:MAG TPA: tetratricopeptide repeat protein [Planctomycetota bacterium]|nr:tetratricopeptide repeat protein [Planctomycetota bacterium]